MKPLSAPTCDDDALRELGRASVQVVHDLKNQLNGLKLYATFLRKRMEKSGRPADEMETIGKIIAGLERAAADTSTLVRYGRPLELDRQPQDLAGLVAGVVGEELTAEAGPYAGSFDAGLLRQALADIHDGVRALCAPGAGGPVSLRREGGGAGACVVEWRGLRPDRNSGEMFSSLAGSGGLRLALAAKIVRAHGGAIELEGDALRVRIPVQSDG